jgi:DNA primase
VLVLPDGKDPDEFIRARASEWPTLVRDALPVIDFVLQRLGGRHDLSTAQGKRAAADEMTEVLAGIADPIEQDHFITEVAMLLGAQPSTIRGLLRRRSQPVQSPAPAAPSVNASETRGESLDDYLLALLIRLGELNRLLPQGELEFLLPESRAVFGALGGTMPPELQPYADRALRKLGDVRRLSDEQLMAELDNTQREIREKLLERKRKEIRSLGDESEIRALLDQLNDVARSLGAIEQERSPQRESAGSR